MLWVDFLFSDELMTSSFLQVNTLLEEDAKSYDVTDIF